jgi:hypothetical protein
MEAVKAGTMVVMSELSMVALKASQMVCYSVVSTDLLMVNYLDFVTVERMVCLSVAM